jgi:hypothetical protein
MHRDEDEKAKLNALVEGRKWQKLADGHPTERPAG